MDAQSLSHLVGKVELAFKERRVSMSEATVEMAADIDRLRAEVVQMRREMREAIEAIERLISLRQEVVGKLREPLPTPT